METNQIKGYNYEIQIRNHIINNLKKQAYLWNDVPETLLIKAGIIASHNENRLRRKEFKENPLQDTGVDIIQVDNDNTCSFVQCKNGYKSGVTYNHLAGFLMWMMSFQNIKGYVYYTSKISSHIRSMPKNDRVDYIKLPYLENIVEEQSTHSIKPYDYQIKAKNNFEEYFKTNDRGILSMPCGTGKTFTSFLISQKYKQIFIISPLKQFAKQNLDRYIEYGYNESNTLLVDSDGERDIKHIEKFIKEKKSFIISSTYCSTDVIYESLKYTNLKDVLIIVDEFHNITKTNMIEEEDNFNKILYSPYRILFMSATPRIYEMEYEEDDNEEINNELFGEIVYNMTFTEAIEKKYITDYRIWLPSIHEDISKLNEELSIYEIDSQIKAKCNYLFSCLLNNGSKKCIIYCIDNEEINKMKEGLNKLNEFYCLEYEINQITSIDTSKKRENILNKFSESLKIQLLFSIRILDECIDISSCDSIYITYPTKNKIRTIQRICRCIRIDKKNSFKIGNIYIWCDKYDKILDTLSGIKEYDIFFKDKIKINESDFFGEKKEDGVKEDLKLIEKYVLEIKEFRCLIWEEKFEWVKNYIDENGKKPSQYDKNIKIQRMGEWINTQKHNYKHKILNMKDKNIYDKWTEFINNNLDFFTSFIDNWKNKLNQVKNYYKEYKKIPTKYNIDNTDKEGLALGKWITKQKMAFNNKDRLMQHDEILSLWNEFRKEYNITTNIDIWYENFESLIKYIEKYNIIPSTDDQNEKIAFIGRWNEHQIRNYKEDRKTMNSNLKIKEMWIKHIEKYNNLYNKKSNDEIFIEKIKKVESYILKYKKFPSTYHKNIEYKKLALFINEVKKNNKNKKENSKTKKIYEDFYKKYEIYFPKDITDIWIENIKSLENFIIINKRKPLNNQNEKKIYNWYYDRLKDIKDKTGFMKDEERKKVWNEFITKYNKYFKSQ
jgi:superfamily II DNA or RNA helicase